MRHRRAPRRALSCALATLALWLLIGGGGGGAGAIPAAHAAGACNNGCIHWDASMIYAGQNNGFPEGPVGEHTLVHGEGFSAEAGQAMKLQLVKGDVNNPPGGDTEFCKLEPTKVALKGSVTPD